MHDVENAMMTMMVVVSDAHGDRCDGMALLRVAVDLHASDRARITCRGGRLHLKRCVGEDTRDVTVDAEK